MRLPSWVSPHFRTCRQGRLCPSCCWEVTGRKLTVKTEGDSCGRPQCQWQRYNTSSSREEYMQELWAQLRSVWATEPRMELMRKEISQLNKQLEERISECPRPPWNWQQLGSGLRCWSSRTSLQNGRIRSGLRAGFRNLRTRWPPCRARHPADRTPGSQAPADSHGEQNPQVLRD